MSFFGKSLEDRKIYLIGALLTLATIGKHYIALVLPQVHQPVTEKNTDLVHGPVFFDHCGFPFGRQ